MWVFETLRSNLETDRMWLPSTFRRVRGSRGMPVLAALIGAIALAPSAAFAQKAFGTPEEAFAALAAAIGADDKAGIVEIFGTEYEDRIVTPDWDAEVLARKRIFEAAKVRQEFNEISQGEIEWVIGDDEWPFPIRLKSEASGQWSFDTGPGIEAMIDRRIGRNELTAISIVDAYVDAQLEYVQSDHDGDEVLEFAQRLASTPGHHDGLYWQVGAGEPDSPFGPLVVGAESYLDTVANGDPIRGYYFRVLTSQGENPPGGAYDYVINGNMIAGFALVAYPADYEISGVMTFVVNHRGVIQQKDLGPFTGMERYDPDDSWSLVSSTGDPKAGAGQPAPTEGD